MQHLKLIKNIVNLLNDTFPPSDVVNSHFEIGRHVVDNIVKIANYYAATYDKKDACVIWVNNYGMYTDNEANEYYTLIKKAAQEEGLTVGIQYIYAAMADTVKKPTNIYIK